MSIIRVWENLTCGGTLTLTKTELLDTYRGRVGRLSHTEFMKRTDKPDSTTYRVIVSTYGQEIVDEIRAEIQRIKADGARGQGTI